MPVMLHTTVEWLLAALVLLGCVFMLAGAIGLTRFPDTLMRLHAPTNAATLGVGSLLLASMGAAAWSGRLHLGELLITLFIFITAPIGTNLLAQAALHLHLRSVAGPPPHTVTPEAHQGLHASQPDKAQSATSSDQP